MEQALALRLVQGDAVGSGVPLGAGVPPGVGVAVGTSKRRYCVMTYPVRLPSERHTTFRRMP